MKTLYFLLAIASGFGTAFEGPASYNIALVLNDPYAPGMVLCFLSTLILIAITFSQKNRPNVTSIRSVPLWQWGIGATLTPLYYIAITYASGLVGLSVMLITLIVAQVGTGMTFDVFGILVPRRKISRKEYLSAGVAAGGALMVVLSRV